jgi:hypothetical protein
MMHGTYSVNFNELHLGVKISEYLSPIMSMQAGS